MNEVQFSFPSEPCKPLKLRSLYVVLLIDEDVCVERRRACDYLNHEEVQWQSWWQRRKLRRPLIF